VPMLAIDCVKLYVNDARGGAAAKRQRSDQLIYDGDANDTGPKRSVTAAVDDDVMTQTMHAMAAAPLNHCTSSLGIVMATVAEATTWHEELWAHDKMMPMPRATNMMASHGYARFPFASGCCVRCDTQGVLPQFASASLRRSRACYGHAY